jgi:hypothetical protein
MRSLLAKGSASTADDILNGVILANWGATKPETLETSTSNEARKIFMMPKG